jgi:hypothetical protein
VGDGLACHQVVSHLLSCLRECCELLPSFLCLSSNIFMAMKEAPPASSSWLNSALLSSW